MSKTENEIKVIKKNNLINAISNQWEFQIEGRRNYIRNDT